LYSKSEILAAFLNISPILFSIDKNYAAVLIIWDRMFGTFAAERDEEPVVYGLITPIKTYNPLTIQSKYFVDLFSYWGGSASFKHKVQKALKGPGWNMEKQEDYPLPPIESQEKQWHVPNDWIMNLYVFYQV